MAASQSLLHKLRLQMMSLAQDTQDILAVRLYSGSERRCVVHLFLVRVCKLYSLAHSKAESGLCSQQIQTDPGRDKKLLLVRCMDSPYVLLAIAKNIDGKRHDLVDFSLSWYYYCKDSFHKIPDPDSNSEWSQNLIGHFSSEVTCQVFIKTYQRLFELPFWQTNICGGK